MTTPDMPEINARLADLLAQLQATPPPPPPPPPPFDPANPTGAPKTREEKITMVAAILEPHEASPEDAAQAVLDATRIIDGG